MRLVIENPVENHTSLAFVPQGLAAMNNVKVLANIKLKQALGFSTEFDTQIIKKTNIEIYEIGGEKAAAFTYYKKPTTPTINNQELYIENVYVIHNGQEYELQFVTGVDGFYNSTIKRGSTLGSINNLARKAPETNKPIITNTSKSKNADIFKLTNLFLNDASHTVANNNTDKALMRLKLARENLAISGNVNSTLVRMIMLLIDDTIESLQSKDIEGAATRILIAEERLNSTTGSSNQEINTSAPSSASTPNEAISKTKAAAENVTKLKAQGSLQKVHSNLSTGPAIVNLTIFDLAYYPNPVKVKKGDVIQVTNKDPIYQYTVTNDNRSIDEEPGKDKYPSYFLF